MAGFLGAASQLPSGVRLREADSGDQDFLAALYASTRAEEMARVTAWTGEQKQAFLRSQFDLQDQHYHQHYPGAERLLIEEGGAPVGRVFVNVTRTEIRVMDVALVPVARGRGIGSALMKRLLEFADRAALPVTLHVEPFNPALRMYERQGFALVEMRGIYQFMRRPVAAGHVAFRDAIS